MKATAQKKMTAREAKSRAKHAEWVLLAAATLRGYGFPELGDELGSLAERIRSGQLGFDAARIID